GCTPGQDRADEEKEPHYVLGQSRVNSMDYQGAVEAFEQSLEVNPRSAQAHYQLAMLFDTNPRVADPAAAIYHYQQYLKLDPNASNGVIVKQRVEACRQQLARDVMSLPAGSATQQQLEKLIEQNRDLQDQLAKWQAYAASMKTNEASPSPNPNPAPAPQGATGRSAAPAPHPTAPKTYKVVSGETAASICRKAGVSLKGLQAANPGVNLGKIRVGQILNLPAQ
ncbi:MAG TPA: LysM peptidoglycan-binding domain-containing protein, partial [Desulfuromonadaceae bacterium]|nr:LysM peptidoglycan-binding domain-containing protein [Desulfuromonadaceae bacterium]